MKGPGAALFGSVISFLAIIGLSIGAIVGKLMKIPLQPAEMPEIVNDEDYLDDNSANDVQIENELDDDLYIEHCNDQREVNTSRHEVNKAKSKASRG